MLVDKTIAILGGGNIGISIAKGIMKSGLIENSRLIITRRHTEHLKEFQSAGAAVMKSNTEAAGKSDIIIIAVQPGQLKELLSEIAGRIKSGAIVISVVSGAKLSDLKTRLGSDVRIVRAMPNTAISLQQSMTCLASEDEDALEVTAKIFDCMGKTLVIGEELMVPATALCACGIAFFLRAIRAASQGGIEIGFHSEEALLMAAQTAKGAAELLLAGETHPESEVDKVTTPRGCTISGLNQMEHNGFSSAMIKGIVSSAEKAEQLYSGD